MAKLSKAKARKRLLEAQRKFQKVYMEYNPRGSSGLSFAPSPVRTADMVAVAKIVERCIKRIQ